MSQVRATHNVPYEPHEEEGKSDMLDTLSPHYVIPYQGRVRAYVRRFPELVTPLVEIPKEVHNYFPHTHLSLDVDHDPEYGIEVGLVVCIHVPHLSLQSAYERFQQFGRVRWFGDSIPTAICVTVTFEEVPEERVYVEEQKEEGKEC